MPKFQTLLKYAGAGLAGIAMAVAVESRHWFNVNRRLAKDEEKIRECIKSSHGFIGAKDSPIIIRGGSVTIYKKDVKVDWAHKSWKDYYSYSVSLDKPPNTIHLEGMGTYPPDSPISRLKEQTLSTEKNWKISLYFRDAKGKDDSGSADRPHLDICSHLSGTACTIDDPLSGTTLSVLSLAKHTKTYSEHYDTPRLRSHVLYCPQSIDANAVGEKSECDHLYKVVVTGTFTMPGQQPAAKTVDYQCIDGACDIGIGDQ